jgi:acyl-homoserine lactone acylase PvdQ
VGLLVLIVGVAGMAPVSAAAGDGHYLLHDAGTAANVRNLMPAGEAGVVSPTEYLQHQADPTYFPPHVYDQEALYDGPTFAAPGQLTPAQFQQFTKAATFGVPDDQIQSVEQPQAGLTIVRDKGFGVPHIFATSRALAQYGSGWVSAEDRLFMMDVLRHAGRGNLATLIGSSGYNTDCDTHYGTGYDQADADLQKSQLDPQVVSGGQAFADGVNAYIVSPGFIQHPPAEYVAFPPPLGPALPLPGTPGNTAWSLDDIGAVAALIGSSLGGGGGSEVGNTLAFENMKSIYGEATARQIFDDLHASNDPESPTTLDTAFPYESRAQRSNASVALIDAAPTDPNGCTHTGTPTVNTPGAQSTAQTAAAKKALDIVNSLKFKKHASNATVVNGSVSASGHPIADFGSQAAYWMPEIWMEIDVHAPDWDARGFVFPGTGVFVEIGRGQDFAWSATSAGSDIIDTRVERLCNPDSADPLANVDPASTHYWYKGHCLAMVEKSLQYFVPLSPGTTTAAWTGFENFTVERAVHDDGIAIIQGRTTATVGGQRVPVAISRQRTNFMHELDQAVGFQKWNSVAAVHDAQSFMDAAASVDTTFNWFYVDSRDTAYFSSGKLPLRNPAADPDLLNWGTGEWDWQGLLPASMHPHAINPSRGWMTSWNNRPAPGFGSADSNWDYGSLYRNQLLDRELTKRIQGTGGKLTSTDLFNVMQVASLTDFRAQRLLDELNAVVGPLSTSEQSTYGAALAAMQTWHVAGRDTRQSPTDGAPYRYAEGISYFDAFYPHLIHAIFNPWFDTTGDEAYCVGHISSPGNIPKTFDNPPSDAHCLGGFDAVNNVGSSYDGGWQDAIDKDLRELLGSPVTGAHQHVYCGGGHVAAAAVEGTLATCRREILAALTKGIAEREKDPAALTANDRIDYRSLGLFGLPTEQWANKPTQQQFIEFLADRSSLPVSVATGGMPTTSTAPPLLALFGLLVLVLAASTGVAARRS